MPIPTPALAPPIRAIRWFEHIPAEIRLQVYRDFFHRDKTRVHGCQDDKCEDAKRTIDRVKKKNVNRIDLFLTSKGVYLEAQNIWFDGAFELKACMRPLLQVAPHSSIHTSFMNQMTTRIRHLRLTTPELLDAEQGWRNSFISRKPDLLRSVTVSGSHLVLYLRSEWYHWTRFRLNGGEGKSQLHVNFRGSRPQTQKFLRLMNEWGFDLHEE